ncbi:MAG: hypothetical protein F4Y41_20465 [Gammaproteobacteria bacterium]|nr:hypothetical protein [Gammaproteobacteria bacterium]
MGLDFIRQRAKAFTRSWDRHRLSLRKRDLFSRDPEDSPRTAIARVARELEPGVTILVCAEDAGLSGYEGRTRVASFVDPPPDLVRFVHDGGGYAKGTVLSVAEGAVAEIAIC